MENTNNNKSFIYNLLKEKCPKCKEGDPFKKNLGIFKVPQMKKNCEKCNYKFEREPGYFIGAMYISYGLTIAEVVVVLILNYLLLPNLSFEWLMTSIILTLILLAKKNFKWARLIYLHIFP